MEKKITVTRTKMEQLLDSAQLALKKAKNNEWASNYWTIVVADLLRRLKRLN